MTLIIKTANNGVVITARFHDGTTETSVFETEDTSDDYQGRAAVLWHIIDQLGWFGSKHDEKRIRVHIEERGDDDAKS